jgi:DNA-binding NtrC family response regulator
MPQVFIDSFEPEVAVPLREAASADGYEVAMIETAAEMESRLPRPDSESEYALVLSGGLDRPEVRKMIGLLNGLVPRPPVIGLAAGPDPERAERAETLALDACLRLPPDTDEFLLVLGQQIERFRLQAETGIIGSSPEIREVLERISLIAPVNSTVMITGESGTGKELVARAIHRLSPRRGRPFIAVNCGALPESLLESELFGHEKGAFTGATSRRKGMFELADGGTLFLDEIGEMAAPTQTRLLRVLETRRFMRVGGDTEIQVDVRVIAATNTDLQASVRAGAFRRDLYYRLNVLSIDLPPLRSRRQDIPALVRAFIHHFTEANEREFKGLTNEAMDALLAYSWPGNVRELRNLIESMVVLAPGSVIRAADIPPEIRDRQGGAMLPVPRDLAPEKAGRQAGDTAPQLEFIFRTLVELKLDVEDLRQQFIRYRRSHPELLEGGSAWPTAGEEIEVLETHDSETAGTPENGEDETIEFRPGMTMSDLEREAIIATLRSVDGNRRKAAEMLRIGERTLYRKLREYDIQL